MISGSDATERGSLHGQRGLVIAGSEDPRFPISHVEKHVKLLEDQGAEVTFKTIRSDHFIILSHGKTVAHMIADWLHSEHNESSSSQ